MMHNNGPTECANKIGDLAARLSRAEEERDRFHAELAAARAKLDAINHCDECVGCAKHDHYFITGDVPCTCRQDLHRPDSVIDELVAKVAALSDALSVEGRRIDRLAVATGAVTTEKEGPR